MSHAASCDKRPLPRGMLKVPRSAANTIRPRSNEPIAQKPVTIVPSAIPAISVFPDIGQHLVADWRATDLFATVVHELRTPLTVMRGQTQLARSLHRTRCKP
jgi:signal transduction histidine kinase